jgi:hypothetical protein
MSCGHPGAVSKISWEYVRTTPEGDHYHFERIFPLDGPVEKREKLDAIYAGRELLLFEDEKQVIGMRQPAAQVDLP